MSNQDESALKTSVFLCYITVCASSPPPSGWCVIPPLSFSPSNIFSSWSGTEHIMDGSVKVIILLGWCPETIFLHLRVSVSLPILWIFYQLLNHGSTIGKVTCLAQWYENARYQLYAYQGTQIWARPLNSMTKCSFIQPHQLPSGVGLASFCMHTLPRNLSEKKLLQPKSLRLIPTAFHKDGGLAGNKKCRKVRSLLKSSPQV